ncbi:MAG: ABC transporter ATP-binding protein [Caldilineaceae bacterium]|nr:ABC transporter ATP-binding protein [Caldilineaceae bacterium]
MAESELLLEVRNLKTHFFAEEGIVRAVDGVDFTVARGKTLGVLGESGCGKSVTGFSILRLVQPPGRIVAGEILYHGLHGADNRALDLARCSPTSSQMQSIRGGEIAMIFQEARTSLDPVYTVGSQLIEAIKYHQSLRQEQAKAWGVEMLRRVGLPDPEATFNKYPHQLSGGMCQRVMIAIALSCQPKLLIADEPTTALDVTTEAQVLRLIKDLQEELGMSMIFITHNLGVVAEMADEIVVMYLGKVVEQTDVKALFEDARHPYTQALLRSVPQIGKKSGERLQTVPGSVPHPQNIPAGCPFHPRCPSRMPGLCDRKEPALLPLSGNRLVRCFLYDEDALKGANVHVANT